MAEIILQKAEFLKSAVAPSDFPRDGLPHIVFAGRSNVGKSSVINRLTGRRNLARVGAAPGKTRYINFFLLDRRAYFVDLPGYGYAKVSMAEKARWGRLIEQYFFESEMISLGILIVDARHRPTQDDCVMANWFIQTGCPFIVVANKIDKLKKSETESCLKLIHEVLEIPDRVKLMPFSAEKGTSKDELAREIIQSI